MSTKNPPGEWNGFVIRDHSPEDGAQAVDALVKEGRWVVYPTNDNPFGYSHRNFVSMIMRASDVVGSYNVQGHIVEILNLTIDQEVEIGTSDERTWNVYRVS